MVVVAVGVESRPILASIQLRPCSAWAGRRAWIQMSLADYSQSVVALSHLVSMLLFGIPTHRFPTASEGKC